LDEAEAELDDATFPQASVDWRVSKFLNPVQDQSRCGVGWSFAAVAAVESNWAMRTGNLMKLSEQQIIDCTNGVDFFRLGKQELINRGCKGGCVVASLKYIADNPVTYQANYPYKSAAGPCQVTNLPASPMKLLGWSFGKPLDAEGIKQALLKGPLIAGINADCPEFQLYSDGILDPLHCGNQVNHFVLLVGYGTSKTSAAYPHGMDYWIIRNSFGTSWGKSGYGYIGRGINVLGIESVTVYPTLGIKSSSVQPTAPLAFSGLKNTDIRLPGYQGQKVF